MQSRRAPEELVLLGALVTLLVRDSDAAPSMRTTDPGESSEETEAREPATAAAR